MQYSIHPTYATCDVQCTCGNAFQTRSTKRELSLDICAACHPAYTGKTRAVMTGGRVQQFRLRQAKAQ